MEKKYYYIDYQGQQRGPVDVEEFKNLGINAQTNVWCAGMANWAPAGQIPVLENYIVQLPPAMPPQNNFNYNNNSQQPYQEVYYDAPDSHMIWAILSTLFCCLPFGIVAVIKASQVNSNWNAGNYDLAEDASDSAKSWCWASTICGLIVNGLYIALQVLG